MEDEPPQERSKDLKKSRRRPFATTQYTMALAAEHLIETTNLVGNGF
jgi:hypothetical protein